MRAWTNGTRWLLGCIAVETGLYADRPLRSVSSDGTTRSMTPEEARVAFGETFVDAVFPDGFEVSGPR